MLDLLRAVGDVLLSCARYTEHVAGGHGGVELVGIGGDEVGSRDPVRFG